VRRSPMRFLRQRTSLADGAAVRLCHPRAFHEASFVYFYTQRTLPRLFSVQGGHLGSDLGDILNAACAAQEMTYFVLDNLARGLTRSRRVRRPGVDHRLPTQPVRKLLTFARSRSVPSGVLVFLVIFDFDLVTSNAHESQYYQARPRSS